MKRLLYFLLLVFLCACGGNRPETDPAINIPASEVQAGNVPDLTAGIDRANQEVCRANMQTVSSSIVMYQAQHGMLPGSIDEVSGVPVRCPEGGEYIYTVDNGGWKLECPESPSHGFVENGIPGW